MRSVHVLFALLATLLSSCDFDKQQQPPGTASIEGLLYYDIIGDFTFVSNAGANYESLTLTRSSRTKFESLLLTTEFVKGCGEHVVRAQLDIRDNEIVDFIDLSTAHDQDIDKERNRKLEKSTRLRICSKVI